MEPSENADGAATLDVDELDAGDWRSEGPWDVTEVDLDVEPAEGQPRIDLGSMLVTGFPGAELRLQVSEESQQVVSVMLIRGDSAIELGAYAAPRTGGFWPELREELVESATEAGGSAAIVEGPVRRRAATPAAGHHPRRRAGLPAIPHVGGRGAALVAARNPVRPGGAGGRCRRPGRAADHRLPAGGRPPQRPGDGARRPAAAGPAEGPDPRPISELWSLSRRAGHQGPHFTRETSTSRGMHAA